MPLNEPGHPVVLFDGVCGFCNRFVTLALKNDSSGELLFAPNRSRYGQELCQRLSLAKESERTIIVVIGDRVLLRSDAVIFISKHLKKPYSYLGLIRVFPRFVRDLGYRAVASIRRLVPLNHLACELLPPELQPRILE
jgi:predicted DCC family thiol-disulfide oxidoreductase YuxK